VPDAATYVARAASYDQLVIRASAVALTDGDAATEGLRRTLAEEHRGLAAQLSFAGRRLNLLPSPVLLANHQAWLDEFAAAPTRAAYLRLMRRVHQNSYAMHAGFAERGASPTLRPVARNAADTERRHFAALR
jgi:putative membrane protein